MVESHSLFAMPLKPRTSWFLAGGGVLLFLIVIGVFLRRTSPDKIATIRIDGSSTVFPFTEAAIEEFSTSGKARETTFRLSESGTTAGFRRFCSGDTAISNASRPINTEELEQCRQAGVEFIELPVAFDAISVVVHPSNTWARTITLEQLRRLWNKDAEGTVKQWSQVDPQWPDRPIRLFGPGADSGTFDYFNKAVNGDPANTRTDVVTSEDDNVLVDAVAQDPLALAYFGFEYLQGNRDRIRPLALVQSDGSAVLPSVEAVQNDTYRPLARPIFLYVNDEQLQSSRALRAFIDYTVANGARIATKAGSIPLIDSTYRLTESKVYKRVRGTAYDGRLSIGLTLGEVLNRSLDQDKKPEFRG
jgi:phosphate transport system substrate-binding protein